MRLSIRNRLLTIVLLGVVTSAFALTALVRILSLSFALRIERGHEAVTEEIERLEAAPPSPHGDFPWSPSTTYVGMRSGYWEGERSAAHVPKAWYPPLRDVTDAALASGKKTSADVTIENGTLVLCATPLPSGRLAWVGYVIRPPPYLRTWQIIVIGLALATALVVTSALYAVATVRRSAGALNASLLALASDLSAPVPRPEVRELGEVADGIAFLARSLAESRRVEERLGRELAERERLAALGRVVAGVAHEVRNPLASIKLRLDLAAASESLPEVVERAIANASSEIARLDRLVADLLVVSGRAVGPRKPTALGPLLRARAETLAPWAAERHVAIDVTGEAMVPIDPSSFSRAFDNLLRNAVEASPPDGTVAVRVDRVDGGAAIRVDDRGAGVAQGRAPELFEPFFTTKSDGTGLGLAIARSIARAHGGDIAYSRRGAVTRFEISLPGAAATAPEASR